MGQLVHDHMVENPRRHVDQPIGDANVGGAYGARTPTLVLVANPLDRGGGGQAKILGKAPGPALEIDRVGTALLLDAAHYVVDVSGFVVGGHPTRNSYPDHPVDNARRHGFGAAIAAYDLDRIASGHGA